ncbi:MAG: RagB/SusD family nutrient uptake outer membrane protein [Siphonobacter sp.]
MNRYIIFIFFVISLFSAVGCKDQLDVGNPNSPTVAGNVTDETGLISYAQGAVYVNGFMNNSGYFYLPYGYIELMGDVIGAQASNYLISTMAIPDYATLDDGTTLTNSSPSITQLRSNNSRAQTGSGYNPLYYQWTQMYSMNMALNDVLSIIDDIVTDEDKANTFKAWCYFWKGYAYASIGSMYYSGLIIDETNGTSSEYVTQDVVIERSNYYYNLATSTLESISTSSTYEDILGELIPTASQTGNGGVLTIDMFKRNINTMLARNILLNKLAPYVNNDPSASITTATISAMTTSDWNSVLTYATNGIQEGDYVFTGRSTSTNSLFSATGGNPAALTTGTNTSTWFKLTERFVQNYKSTDQRLANNLEAVDTYLDEMTYGTRWNIIDGGNGLSGVSVLSNRTVGEYELYIAGSYEENALMLAEANLRLGNIDVGLAYIDAVRTYQGAGVTAVSGTGLTLAEAMQELVTERRVALVFRGISFYDSRRWGWTYDISNGGGSYGNVVLSSAGDVNTDVTINYNFLDYWDVPADESVLNPSTSSVATTNPNF